MLVIGMLGGVASGKTAVAKCFEQEGCLRIDGDVIGHRVLQERKVAQAVRNQWGVGVLDAAGRPDRRKLAAIVFDEKTPTAAAVAGRAADRERIRAAGAIF